jgi:DNA-directed RNA polymerase subunit RPC12/RpoP
MSRTVDTLYYCEWCNIVTDKVADERVDGYNACPQCNEIVGFDSQDYLEEVGRWKECTHDLLCTL